MNKTHMIIVLIATLFVLSACTAEGDAIRVRDAPQDMGLPTDPVKPGVDNPPVIEEMIYRFVDNSCTTQGCEFEFYVRASDDYGIISMFEGFSNPVHSGGGQVNFSEPQTVVERNGTRVPAFSGYYNVTFVFTDTAGQQTSRTETLYVSEIDEYPGNSSNESVLTSQSIYASANKLVNWNNPSANQLYFFAQASITTSIPYPISEHILSCFNTPPSSFSVHTETHNAMTNNHFQGEYGLWTIARSYNHYTGGLRLACWANSNLTEPLMVSFNDARATFAEVYDIQITQQSPDSGLISIVMGNEQHGYSSNYGISVTVRRVDGSFIVLSDAGSLNGDNTTVELPFNVNWVDIERISVNTNINVDGILRTTTYAGFEASDLGTIVLAKNVEETEVDFGELVLLKRVEY